MKYLPLVMLIPLTALITGDFRRREISLVWLVAFAAGTIGTSIIKEGWQEMLTRSWQNALVLSYLGIGIIIWSRMKAKRFINPVGRYIGLGDLLFFLTLIPLFPVRRFAWLLVGSMLFSLAWWRVARLRKRVPENVPLVATSGIVMAVAIIFNVFSQ